MFDISVYRVLDDYGTLGRAYRETDESKADVDTVISDMLTGQFNEPLRVVEFSTSEGWSRDCSEEIAWEVLKLANRKGQRLPDSTFGFVDG